TGLGCHKFDFAEVNASSDRGVASMRQIISDSQRRPRQGKVRVWLFDECHGLTNDAQEALLKSMKDTPSHVVLIFATTEPNKLKPTFRNRCS
ncbi:unnamed protein product, partial [marine sediment metagenome]